MLSNGWPCQGFLLGLSRNLSLMCRGIPCEFSFYMPEIIFVGSGGKSFESRNTNIYHHPYRPLINYENQSKWNELEIDSMRVIHPVILSYMSHYQIDSSHLTIDVFQFTELCNEDFWKFTHPHESINCCYIAFVATLRFPSYFSS